MANSANISCRLDAMPWPAALADSRLHVRACNAAFRARWAALGGDPAVLCGASLAQSCPLDEQLRIRHGLWRRRTGEALPHSLRLTSPPTVVDLTPLESDHEPQGWLVTLHEVRHSEEQAIDHVRIAALVHDLKTPLQAVQGWVSLLASKPYSGEQLGRALSIIQRNVRLEADMLAELLDAAHPQGPAAGRRSGRVDVGQVARAAAEGLGPMADEAGVEVQLFAPDAPVTLVGDAQDIARMLSNLLVNAIKFSDRGGRVECRVAQQNGWARVTVRDEGRGITAGFLPHVFDSFCREERPEQPAAEGSGLGLTGVRHLAHKHGGFVEAQSAGPGCGATFVLTLPIDHAAGPEESGDHYGTLRGAHGFRTGAQPGLSAVHDRPRRHVN